MLVLKRNAEQSVLLNNGEIEVIVLSVKGNEVRLGFKAPKSIQIQRSEVAAEIETQNLAAANPSNITNLPTATVT